MRARPGQEEGGWLFFARRGSFAAGGGDHLPLAGGGAAPRRPARNEGSSRQGLCLGRKHLSLLSRLG